MDLGSTIVGAIFIAVCILPFVLMSRNRKKRENYMLQSLTDIANQQNCKIIKHEFYVDFVIGIDITKNFLFYFKKVKNDETAQYINLDEIQNCKIINTSKTVKSKESNFNVIDRLELTFIPYNKNKKNISLEFYNADTSLQLSKELQSIEKWAKLINYQLKDNRNRNLDLKTDHCVIF